VQYTDSGALAVDTVNTVGLTASDIVLSAGGTLTLAQNVAATTGDVRLVTTADVNQTSGALTANNLGVIAATGVALAQSSNNAANVAILNATSGDVSYRDSDGFAIGTVTALGAFTPAVNGISSANGNVTLNAGGAVTQTQAVTAQGLELLGTGPYTLTSASNDVVTLAGSVTNAVQYTDTNAFTVGTVNTVGLSASDIVLSAGGTLGLSQNLAATTGDVRLITTADVNQTGGAVTANNLGVIAVSGVSLSSATNNAATLAISNATSGNVSYRDTDGFAIGTVTARSRRP
jgi:hypothetical protein